MRTLRIKTLGTTLGGLGTHDPLQNDWGDMGAGAGGCGQPRNCTTTYTGPMGVECCCFYDCPSGGTWVCKQGQYCAA